MNRSSLFAALLLAAASASAEPAAPSSAPASVAPTSAAPASAPATLRVLPKRKIRAPIKLYRGGGALHPAMRGGRDRIKLTPQMLKGAMKVRGHAAKTAPGGFRQFGQYWVRTPQALDPAKATVSEWMRLVRGSLRSARPLKAPSPPAVASPASAGKP